MSAFLGESDLVSFEQLPSHLETEASTAQGLSLTQLDVQKVVLHLLETMNRLLQEMQELKQRVPDLPNQPGADDTAVIRYILRTQEDVDKISKMSSTDIREMLAPLGEAWGDITEAKYLNPGANKNRNNNNINNNDNSDNNNSKKQPCILFTIKTWESEKVIRKDAGEISRVLNLSLHCYPLARRYVVHIVDFIKQACMDHKFDMTQWIRRFLPAEVDITAKMSFDRLLLETQQHTTALFLCRKPLVLDNISYTAVPFCPQGTPLFCYNCQVPGHFKEACSVPNPRCGLCAAEHNTKDCPPGTPLRCSNCQKKHKAWDHLCRDSRSRREHESASQYRRVHPYWAESLYTDTKKPLAQQASDAAAEGSQKRQKAGSTSTTKAGAIEPGTKLKKGPGRPKMGQITKVPGKSQPMIGTIFPKKSARNDVVAPSEDTDAYTPVTSEDRDMTGMEDTSPRGSVGAKRQTGTSRKGTPSTMPTDDESAPMDLDSTEDEAAEEQGSQDRPSPRNNKGNNEGNKKRGKQKKTATMERQTKEAEGAQDTIVVQPQNTSKQASRRNSGKRQSNHQKESSVVAHTETSDSGEPQGVTKSPDEKAGASGQEQDGLSSSSESEKTRNKNSKGRKGRNQAKNKKKEDAE
ncbi:hypothetical protein FSARC_11967, partial [Fusarium sarcochroum]